MRETLRRVKASFALFPPEPAGIVMRALARRHHRELENLCRKYVDEHKKHALRAIDELMKEFEQKEEWYVPPREIVEKKGFKVIPPNTLAYTSELYKSLVAAPRYLTEAVLFALPVAAYGAATGLPHVGVIGTLMGGIQAFRMARAAERPGLTPAGINPSGNQVGNIHAHVKATEQVHAIERAFHHPPLSRAVELTITSALAAPHVDVHVAEEMKRNLQLLKKDIESGVHHYPSTEGKAVAVTAAVLASLGKSGYEAGKLRADFMKHFLEYVEKNARSKSLRKRAEKAKRKWAAASGSSRG